MVIREKLYDIIRKRIFKVNEASYLFKIYDITYFQDPIEKRKVFLKNGVH